MKKSASPMRKKFCSQVKALGIRYRMPINKIYQLVYDRVREETGINLYAEAKQRGAKPLDVAEKHGLFGRMLDIAGNIGFDSLPHTGTRIYSQPSPQTELIPENIDPETGEILD